MSNVRQAGDRGRRCHRLRGGRHQSVALDSGRGWPGCHTLPIAFGFPDTTAKPVADAGHRLSAERRVGDRHQAPNDRRRCSVLVHRADVRLDQQRRMGHRQGSWDGPRSCRLHPVAQRGPHRRLRRPVCPRASPADRRGGDQARGRRGRAAQHRPGQRPLRRNRWWVSRQASRDHLPRQRRLQLRRATQQRRVLPLVRPHGGRCTLRLRAGLTSRYGSSTSTGRSSGSTGKPSRGPGRTPHKETEQIVDSIQFE